DRATELRHAVLEDHTVEHEARRVVPAVPAVPPGLALGALSRADRDRAAGGPLAPGDRGRLDPEIAAEREQRAASARRGGAGAAQAAYHHGAPAGRDEIRTRRPRSVGEHDAFDRGVHSEQLDRA